MAKIAGIAAKNLEGVSTAFALGALNDNTLAAFLFIPSDESGDDVMNRVYEGMMKSMGGPYEIFMACGEPVKSLSCIAHSYQTARRAMEKSFFSKQRRFIRYQEKSSAAMGQEEFSTQAEIFAEYIRNGKKNEALKLLDAITLQVSMHPATKADMVVDFFFKLILELLKQKSSTFFENAELIDIRNWVNGCFFLEDISDYTARFIQDYFQDIYKKNSSSEIDQVLSIIRQQYGSKKLSLHEISRQTFRSTSYICVKFREATGKTFTQYLSEYRVEKSLELLRDKSLKIVYIAEKVGFDNGNYFSKTFFKLKGVTPQEYRKRFISDKESG
jgi:two-component system response regulator YesN